MMKPMTGDHAHVPTFGMSGRVERYDGDWAVVDLGDGLAASKPSELVISSMHARRRWRQRVADDEDPSEGIANAWERGEELDPDECDMDADELRHDMTTGAVMVLQGNTIATVIGPAGRKTALENAVGDLLDD